MATLKARGEKLPKDPLGVGLVRKYLGAELFVDDDRITIDRPGLINGLAWTSMGGAILVIESISIRQTKGGQLKITGQLGEVMSESANIAYSFVRKMLCDNEEYQKFFEEHIVHLHVPAGATPKDGPSAGITMASSIYSLATGKISKPNFAMTGELTLTGKVFPIGGLKEKLIAAKRAGIKEIIFPKLNEKNLEEVQDHVKKGLKFHPVEDMSEVIKLLFKK